MKCRALETASSTRWGFTLPELLVALVLLGVVAGVATRALRSQQRFLRGAAELGELRSQLRQAVHVLPAELRAVAPDAGDIHEWHASAIRFRAVMGSAVVCHRTSDTEIVVPPRSSTDGRALTSWLVAPQAGDSLLIHDEGDIGLGDDVWHAYELLAVGAASDHDACDVATGWRWMDAGEGPSVRLRVSAVVSPTVRAGAAVRIYRPVRYALYRGGDSHWYLGASDCNAFRSPPCSTIQPISGPYLARDSGPGSGLHLTFEDEAGRELIPGIDDPRNVALVRMTVRSQLSRSWWESRALVGDSLAFAIAMRNRIRTNPEGMR